MSYLTIYSVGYIVNIVQKVLLNKTKFDSLTEFLFGDMNKPLTFLVVLPFVGVLLGRLNWFFRSRWNQKLRFANSREVNDHRAKLDIATIKSKKFDDLTRRITELPDSWQTRILFSEEMFSLLGTIISFVLFGTSLIWYKPVYALILFLTALPMAIAEVKYVSMWWILFQELVPINKQRSVLEKAFGGQTAFVQGKMFGQHKTLRYCIDKNISDVIGRNDRIRKIGMIREFITFTISQMGFCAVIIHAIWYIVNNGGEVGTLTVIIASARTFQGNLESIVSLIADQWNSAKGVNLIEEEFFATKSSISTPYPVVPRFDIVPKITFKNVGFTYPEGKKQVLTNLDFTINPGEKVAIVGDSGNGKSTLMALLLRQYDPTVGKIDIGGVDLRNIEPDVWCKLISGLTQEYAILQRPIGEEIASSRLDADYDEERVRKSAEFACFLDVVNSDPKGFRLQIGTEFGGKDFSGGETQRLALARVFYRNTPILTLDEPDARLDPESANEVMENIFAIQGKTIIIITHHVSRALRCDKVIVMKNGRVVEIGAPGELKDKQGFFSRMLVADMKRQGKDKSPESDTAGSE
jgi:ATP-binding cassette subfamily B protein